MQQVGRRCKGDAEQERCCGTGWRQPFVVPEQAWCDLGRGVYDERTNTWDGEHVIALRMEPGERDLARRSALLLCNLLHRLHKLEVLGPGR